MDALLRFLIGEIALSGKTGSSPLDVDRYSEAFEKLHKPAASISSAAFTFDQSQGHLTDNATLRAQTWDWLLMHPDVSLGTSSESCGKARNLGNVEAYNGDILAACRDTHVNDADALKDQTGRSLHCASSPHSAILKLFASSEQMWQAAAGHGIDYSRIPAKDFDCLSVIAAHREKGVIQPTLARLTSQDIRSVPQRTQRLCDAGYVVKVSTLANGAWTSLLILTKFAVQREKELVEARNPSVTGQQSTQNTRFFGLEAEIGTGKYNIVADKIREAFAILRKEQIVTWDDLKKTLGVFTNHRQSRLLAESFRLLESAGAVERIKAKANIPVPGARYHRCIKLQRILTDEELHMVLCRPKGIVARSNDAGDQAPNTVRSESVVKVELGNIHDSPDLQWTPHRQLSHQFRDAVDDEGNDGATQPDIRDTVTGPFFQKPVEQQTGRLVDYWQESQPSHLLHLGIMRDTIQFGRTTMFIHYAAHRLNSLRRNGQVSSNKGTDLDWAHSISGRDEYGFPLLQSSRFVDENHARKWSTIATRGTQLPAKNIRPRGRPRKSGQPTPRTPKLQAGFPWTPNPPLDSSSITPGAQDGQVASALQEKIEEHHIVDAPGNHSTVSVEQSEPLARTGGAVEVSSPSRAHKRRKLTPDLSNSVNGGAQDSPRQVRATPNKESATPRPKKSGARNTRFPASTYAEQEATLVRDSSLVIIGDTFELRRSNVRGRGPNSRLAIFRMPSLTTKPWFKQTESMMLDVRPPETVDDAFITGTPAPTEALARVLLTPTTEPRDRSPSLELSEVQDEPLAWQPQVPRQPRKSGASRAISSGAKLKTDEGSIATFRQQIIMDVMHQAGGLYPGNNELWYPFTTQWMQRYPNMKPDKGTVKVALERLLKQGKLNVLDFSFQTRAGSMSTKRILYLPDIGVESDRVKQLQENIKAADPRSYFPDQPAIAPGLKSHSENLQSGMEGPVSLGKGYSRTTSETVNFWHTPRYAEKLIERAQKRTDVGRAKTSRYSPNGTQLANNRLRPARTARRETIDRTKGLHSRHSLNDTEFFNLQFVPIAPAPRQPDFGHGTTSYLTSGFEGSLLRRVNTTTAHEDQIYNKNYQNLSPHTRFESSVKAIEEWERSPEAIDLYLHGNEHLLYDGKFINLFSNLPVEESDLSDTPMDESVPDTPTGVHNDLRPRGFGSQQDAELEHRPPNDDQIVVAQEKNGMQSTTLTEDPGTLLGHTKRTQPRRSPQIASKPDSGPISGMRKARVPLRQRHRLGEGFGKRLFVAVVLMKTLLGGLDQIFDWNIVGAMLGTPQDQAKFLGHRWTSIRDSYKKISNYVQDKIREVFLRGYEDGTIPTIDFNDIWAYDWRALFEIIISNLDIRDPGEQAPALTKDLSRFDVRQIPTQDFSAYFELSTASTYPKRSLLLHRDAYVRGPRMAASRELPSLLDVAKNWIRANVAAADSKYDSATANAKLGPLGNGVIEKALQQLLSERVLSQKNKGRPVPGRAYDLSEAYMSQLSSPIDVRYYRDGIAFKTELDALFQQQKRASLSENVSDGVIFAFTNMVAYGQIAAVQHNLPATDKGLTGKTYQTREIDERRLRFGIELAPLASYEYGNPLLPLPPAPKCQPRFGDDGQDLTFFPLWYDLSGNLVESLWDTARTTIVSHIAFRPGITSSQLRQTLESRLELFEIELVIGWLVEAGVASWVDELQHGTTLNEWWWMFLG